MNVSATSLQVLGYKADPTHYPLCWHCEEHDTIKSRAEMVLIRRVCDGN